MASIPLQYPDQAPEGNHSPDWACGNSVTASTSTPTAEKGKDDFEVSNQTKHFLDYLKSPIVSIFVGKDRERFYAHKDLLVAKSPFFEACLKPTFPEGQNNEVNLPEDQPNAFKALLGWIYTSEICIDDADKIFHLFDYIELYALANKLMSWSLQNKLVNHLRNKMRVFDFVPHARHLSRIKMHNLLDSPLGNFCLRTHVYSVMKQPAIWLRASGALPQNIRLKSFMGLFKDHNLTTQVVLQFLEFNNKPWQDPRNLKGCHFHVHPHGARVEDCTPEFPEMVR